MASKSRRPAAAPKAARDAGPVVTPVAVKPDAKVAAAIKRDQAETAQKRADLDALQAREAEQRAVAAARLEAGA